MRRKASSHEPLSADFRGGPNAWVPTDVQFRAMTAEERFAWCERDEIPARYRNEVANAPL